MARQNSCRAFQASERRLERESQKQFRELQRRNKEQAKLSALEQARLEVETHQNRMDVLMSMHKEQSEPWDWVAIKTYLPPPMPSRNRYHESAKSQQILVFGPDQRHKSREVLEHARRDDEALFQQALARHSKEEAEWERMRDLACRILAGEHKAYQEALKEFNPFKEVSDFCSKLRFGIHSKSIMVCDLKIKGEEAIPSEIKSLTAGGKVSVKQMPRARFFEFYKDCLCSCMLRVAREIFAILPIETLLITASVDMVEPVTGQAGEDAVLSVAMPRSKVAELDFEWINPADAMEQFVQRGDFKASRKSAAFISITALTPADIASTSTADLSIPELFANVRQLWNELATINSNTNSESDSSASEEWAIS